MVPAQTAAVSREGQYVNGGMHSVSGPAAFEAATPSTVPPQVTWPCALASRLPVCLRVLELMSAAQ